MPTPGPGKFDLILYRGDSYRWRFKLWQDDLKTIPLDLTGATTAAEFRDKPGGTEIVTLDCVVSLPNTIVVDMTPEMWEDAPESGAWDLEVTFADDTIRTVIAGSVVVTPDVTHSSGITTFSVEVEEEPLVRRAVPLRSA